MGFFSRNKEAVDTGRVGSAPFETVRRSPRNSRKRATSDTRFDAGAPIDPAETVKTRARRRLIGAIALALAAIVFVPMLFDRAPAPPPDDIALQIPDRDTPFEGRRGVPDPSRGPLKPAGDLPTVSSPPSLPESASTSASTSPAGPAAPGEVEAPKPSVREVPPLKADKPVETQTPEQSIEKLTERAPAKPKMLPATPPAASAVTADDPHAIAALEGKSDGAGTPAGSGARTFAVQVAAYAAPEKARGMRDQLVAGGLKAYVESVSTAQGLRTRVRLGPFPSRDAADRARAKLKTMKLDGSVVPL